MLDALVHGRELVAQTTRNLALLRKQRGGHTTQVITAGVGHGGATQEAETKIDGEAELFRREGVGRRVHGAEVICE